ncbi:hypothetical protein BN903_13 [Halorubrum sp. AJ67]|nr:hypothetical protein BN903_13 [Halorubrum sp. AJ67]
MEVVELAEFEPFRPVVGPATLGVGQRTVLAGLPVADLQEPLADVRRGAVGTADDDRYHAPDSAARDRIPVGSRRGRGTAGLRSVLWGPRPRYGSNRYTKLP